MTVTINGTTGVSLCDTNSVPTAALQASAVTQPKVGSGVAGNGPAFSAYPNTTQTLSGNTWTKILYQTEEYDTNNNFASSTFTPTVAGYYQVVASMQVATSFTNGLMAVYKNGSVYKQGYTTGSAVTGTFNVLCYVYCNGTTDYIDAYGFIGTGQALNANSTVSYFQACLARAA